MLINQSQFLTRFVARRLSDLISVKLLEERFEPKARLIVEHRFDYNNTNYFINENDYIFTKIEKNKKVFIHNVLQYHEPKGAFTVAIKNASLIENQWASRNKKHFRRVNIDEPLPIDNSTGYIVNYNMLTHIYRYTTSIQNLYYKFYDPYETVIYNVNKVAKINTDFKNILEIEIPNLIPSVSMIERLMNLNDVRFARVVTDNNLRVIIHLLKYLINKKGTIFDGLEREVADRVIIKFKYRKYFSMVGLGLLHSFKKDDAKENPVKLDHDKALKLYYKYIINIQQGAIAEIEKTNKEQETEISVKVPTKDDEEYVEDSEEQDTDEVDLPIQSVTYIDNQVPKLDEEVNVNKAIDNIEANIDKALNQDSLEELLEDIKTEEDEQVDEIFNERLNKSLIEDKEQTVEEIIEKELNTPLDEKEVFRLEDPHTRMEKKIDDLLQKQLISKVEANKYKKELESRKNMASPYDPNIHIDEFKIIKEEEKRLESSKLPVSSLGTIESFKESKVEEFDKRYTTTLIKKDIVNCVTSLENADIIIKEYSVEKDISTLGNYEIHKFVVRPIGGNESVLYMRIPIIDEEGEFVASGVKYRMRKQRADLPIRKISDNEVALSSYYGKLFIKRTDRKAYSYYDYINDTIKNRYIGKEENTTESGKIIKLEINNLFDNYEKTPAIVASLKKNFSLIETNLYTFILDTKTLLQRVNKDDVKALNEKGYYCIGYRKSDNRLLLCNQNDQFFIYSNQLEPLGYIEDMLDIEDPPIGFSETIVLAKKIPLGMVLSYYIGFFNLIKALKVKPIIIPVRKIYKLSKDEYQIKFNDYKVIFKKDNKAANLIFGGFAYFKDYIKEYEMDNFNYRDVYYNVFVERDITNLHLKELNILEDLFLDPITKEVLRDMNEPTSFIPLLLRANEMLTSFDYPDINDPSYSRIKGYERVPGLMYRTLVKAVRNYRFKPGLKNKIELDPYDVWNAVLKDNACKIVEDINPVVDLKEHEAVTLAGSDGLNKDNVQIKLREFHKNDMGLTSEASVDNSDVGVNTFVTPDFKVKSIRGVVDVNNKNYRDNPDKLFSTSALLAPFVEYDDPKRVNFINIQNGHTIATQGYVQPVIRTGYESVMPYRVGKLYCVIAKDDCTVIYMNNKIMKVKYKNGDIETIQIGRIYGKAEGTTYPHEIYTPYKVGDKIKKDQYICYNKNFFEEDWYNKGQLIFKMNQYVKVALTESEDVYEDSCSISQSFSDSFVTRITKERSFIIEFDKNIVNLLPVGTVVEPNDTLFTIVNEVSDYQNLDKKTVSLLQTLNNVSPKAKYKGVIERYEVKYNGDIEDMSPTLKAICSKLDKEIEQNTKDTQYPIKNNRVTSEYRVDGKNLQVDTLELKVYITIDLTAGVGDKLIFGSQLKTIIGDVFSDKYYTDKGEEVQAFFAFRGIYNRIVLSPILMGTTKLLLDKFNEIAVKEYFG